MTELSQLLSSLRRPKLLVRTARYGVVDYRRRKSLRRLFPGERLECQSQILPRLLETEAALDLARRDGTATYSPARHIETLTALIAEAKAVNELNPVQVNASGTAAF